MKFRLQISTIILRVGVAVLALTCARIAAAQNLSIIKDFQPRPCACQIERIRIAKINDSAIPHGAIQSANLLTRLSNGGYLLMSGLSFPQEIFFADKAGHVIKQIGREGEGPGEFSMPIAAAESPTSLVVYDARLRRLTWLDKTALIPGRSVATEVAISRMIAYKDGSMAVIGSGRSRSTAGATLHILDKNGTVIRSFRPLQKKSPDGPDNPIMIAPSGDSAFLVASTLQYRIEKWSIGGKLLAIYQRNVEWFRPFDIDAKTHPGEKAAWLDGLAEDSNGNIWVAILRRQYSQLGAKQQFEAQYTRTTIEVLDPSEGAVVATLDVPGKNYTIAGGFYQTGATDSELDPTLDVWGYQLRTKPAHH